MEPMAIIGLGGEFPGASNPGELWDLLLRRESAWSKVPEDRYSEKGHYHPDPHHVGTMNVKGGHFLKRRIGDFDAPFFSITESEAKAIDPQQRLLLEKVYEALENAGISLESIAGSRTGCFVGLMTHDYELMAHQDHQELPILSFTGITNSMAANRVSWMFDLKGPSITLDTACSSTLTALHLACQSLCAGESDMVIAAGVNLIFNPDCLPQMTRVGLLSPDGKSYSFDHRANGYARSEGCAVVVVKLLSRALADGDIIRAVIRGTAINSDGHTPGITNPSQSAQEALMLEAYQKAGLDLSSTRFFEAHGTGTPTGDPVEAGGIAAVFGTSQSDGQSVYVGALKSNVGHMEAASGIAGLIKTVMVLEKGLIPPNANFEKINPRIPADRWRLKFPQEVTLWPSSGLRRASVNSFGYGGANAHVILEDAYNHLSTRGLQGRHMTDITPFLPGSVTTNGHSLQNGLVHSPIANGNGINGNGKSINGNGINGNGHRHDQQIQRVFVWSASEKSGLQRLSSAYSSYLSSDVKIMDEETFLGDLAYTLGERRSRLAWRGFAIASSLNDLKNQLHDGLKNAIKSSRNPAVGFVFTGQGAQWYAMGRDLLQHQFPIFLESIQKSDAYTKSLGCSWSVMDHLTRDEESSEINKPDISQCLCTALQIALVDLLRSWRITPEAVVGHSSGEIAAAYATNALTQEEAIKIAYFRGQLSMQLVENPCTKGGMMAIFLSEANATPYIDKVRADHPKGELVIACENSMNNITASGDLKLISALHVLLNDDQVPCRLLKVDNAYHSNHMRQVAPDYLRLLAGLNNKDPTAQVQALHQPIMFSSVSGVAVSREKLRSASYWAGNLVGKVNFRSALHSIMEYTWRGEKGVPGRQGSHRISVLVEIGPHGALERPIRQELSSPKFAAHKISYYSSLNRNLSAIESSLSLAASLFCHGVSIALENINVGTSSQSPMADLPTYPWSRERQYWSEGRKSKNTRFRQYGLNEVLGLPVDDWNESEPRWINFLRQTEMPWIGDHKVTGKVVYPAAGFLAMAVEAASRFIESGRKVAGYRIHQAVFKKALIFPEDSEGVEVQLSFHPSRYGDSNSADGLLLHWKEFTISSYSNNTASWSQHCSGLISIDYEAQHDQVDGGRETNHEEKQLQSLFEQASLTCTHPIDIANLYDHLDRVGLQYGPTFQGISKSTCSREGGECVGEIKKTDLESCMPKSWIQGQIIHPTMLDTLFQLFLTALCSSEKLYDTPAVPTFIENFWVSNEISTSFGGSHKCHVKAENVGFRTVKAEFSAVNKTGKVMLLIQGFEATELEVNDKQAVSTSNRANRCFKTVWSESIDLLNKNQMIDLFSDPNPVTPQRIKVVDDMKLATLVLTSNALQQLTPIEQAQLTGHLQHYFHWMQTHMKRAASWSNSTFAWKDIVSNQELQSTLIEQVRSASVEGRTIVRIGENLPQILRLEVTPLELLLKDNLLDRLYEECMFNDARILYIPYIDLYCKEHDKCRVLEIGAGTGGTTWPLLEALLGPTGSKSSSIMDYTFTDISAGFFIKAQEKSQPWAHIVKYQILNIELDPMEQGFEEAAYDIIVASNVLHATKSLDNTLKNVRKLLKPGGKLVLQELTLELDGAEIIFGTLPGWWMGVDDERSWGPLVSEDIWGQRLSRNGFSGLDLTLRNSHVAGIDCSSFILSTAISEHPDIASQFLSSETIIITSSDSPAQFLVTELETGLRQQGLATSIVTFRETTAATLNGKACLFLADLDMPLLSRVNEDELRLLQSLISSVSSLLWVTQGGTMSTPQPLAGMVAGLARNMKTERPSLRFTTLDFETEPIDANKILEVFLKTMSKQQHLSHDTEYTVRNNTVYIPRLVTAEIENEAMLANSPDFEPEAKPQPLISDSQESLKLQTSSLGLLSDLVFVDDTLLHNSPLAANDVEIEVKAVGLNEEDFATAMGDGNHSHSFGYECSGIVSKVGSDVDNFMVGDRVLAEALGSFKTFARASYDLVQKIPDRLSHERAAALPLIYSVAYYAIVEIANLQKNETILIHAAARPVGQAAILLAQHYEARVFATVGSNKEKQFLMERYNISEDCIFPSQGLSFTKGISRLTNGRGVDVALNHLTGEGLRQTWECIAPFGRFVELGREDMQRWNTLQMHPFLKNIRFASVNWTLVLQTNGALAARILSKVMDLFRARKIVSQVPVDVFGFSETEVAFKTMQGGNHTRKIVLMPRATERVLVAPGPNKPVSFHSDATYVLVGGLGGMGIPIAHWMVERNAKNLLILSRSGSKSRGADSFVAELQQKGINIVIYACDVGNEEELNSVIKKAMTKLPTIRGCIQGAMVLQDKLFEDMSLDDWQIAQHPKVNGSKNLQKILPKTMDFFVFLSSASSVTGVPGQSNYNVGNAFESALARSLSSKGQHALSIELGHVRSVGWAAENKVDFEFSKKNGIAPIDMDEILSLLDYATDAKKSRFGGPHFVAGLDPTSFVPNALSGDHWIQQNPMFSCLRAVHEGNTIIETADSGPSITELLESSTSMAAAKEIIVTAVVTKLCKLLSLAPESIDIEKPLFTYGVDSLVALEIRNWIGRAFSAEIPVLVIMSPEPLSLLTTAIARKSRHLARLVLGEAGN